MYTKINNKVNQCFFFGGLRKPQNILGRHSRNKLLTKLLDATFRKSVCHQPFLNRHTIQFQVRRSGQCRWIPITQTQVFGSWIPWKCAHHRHRIIVLMILIWWETGENLFEYLREESSYLTNLLNWNWTDWAGPLGHFRRVSDVNPNAAMRWHLGPVKGYHMVILAFCCPCWNVW